MEAIGLLVIFATIGWQIWALRRDLSSLAQSTTVFYSVESNENDSNGLAEACLNFRKRMRLPIAITPGMEFTEIANNRPTLVTRVVFDSEGREVHLKSGRAPREELEDLKNWYQKRGWTEA